MQVGIVLAFSVRVVLAETSQAGEVSILAIGLCQLGQAVEQPRPRDAELHRIGVVTIDAGDGVIDERLTGIVFEVACLVVRHGANQLKAFLYLLALVVVGDARFATVVFVGGDDRGMAVEAGPPLFVFRDAFGLLLIAEHVGVAPLLAIVDRERVAGEEDAVARELVEALEGFAAAESRACDVNGLLVAIELARVVLAPFGGVDRSIGDRHDAKDGFLSFVTALADILPKVHHARGGQRGEQDDCGVYGPAAWCAVVSRRGRWLIVFRHGSLIFFYRGPWPTCAWQRTQLITSDESPWCVAIPLTRFV